MPDTPSAIRIVIADDHPLVREGLRRLFDLQPGFDVIGEAADGVDAVQKARALRPDVLLLDVAMPRMNGLEALQELEDLGPPTRVVLLTAAIEPEEALVALRRGAAGIVLKETATQILYRCVRAVTAGEFWVGHERIADLMQSIRKLDRAASGDAPPAERLTRRQFQVIAAVVDGASNKEISGQLGISEQTVKNQLSRIFDLLGVSSRLELALYAVHHRLLANHTPSDSPTGSARR